MEFGLIGYPLSHSFSPGFFAEKFARQKTDASYQAYPMKNLDHFREWLAAHAQLKGLNVTIPHKISVIPFLDELSDAAAAIGAVNCISFENGRLKGHNTDVIGFARSLSPLLKPHHTHALILGSGGSARAVAFALRQMNIGYRHVSRTEREEMLSYDQLTPALLEHYCLIINTTPLGMHPQTDVCPPIPYDALNDKHLLYDLIYNPGSTLFLQKGSEQGAAIKNGLEMLHLQAEASWDIWMEVC